ncbi:MAG: hypothetical protein Q4G09_00325 [Clostridia bacterium]|nr:hypothetical protein [Clostridia bacterium]
MAKNTNKTEEIKKEVKVQEHNDRIRALVENMKKVVGEFERGWSIKRLEPMKEEIKQILEENKEKDYLSKSDRNFLFFVNRVIYGKVEQPAWKRQNEPEQIQNTRPENAPKQFEFKSLNDKVARLKQTLEGYGNKCIVTTIEDIKEKSFYCLKETEIDGKMELECSIKFEQKDGIANVTAMTEEEAFAIRNSYMKIKDNPEERNNLSFYVREINNNPIHADNYFIKIATAKENEASFVNSEIIDQEMQEE